MRQGVVSFSGYIKQLILHKEAIWLSPCPLQLEKDQINCKKMYENILKI